MNNPQLLTLNDQDFGKDVIETKGLVLVDFWAEWCAPCHALAPIISDLASEFAGQAKVGKIDVDANPKTAAQFGIRSIPTVLLFKDGKMVREFIGRQSKDVYASVLKEQA